MKKSMSFRQQMTLLRIFVALATFVCFSLYVSAHIPYYYGARFRAFGIVFNSLSVIVSFPVLLLSFALLFKPSFCFATILWITVYVTGGRLGGKRGRLHVLRKAFKDRKIDRKLFDMGLLWSSGSEHDIEVGRIQSWDYTIPRFVWLNKQKTKCRLGLLHPRVESLEPFLSRFSGMLGRIDSVERYSAGGTDWGNAFDITLYALPRESIPYVFETEMDNPQSYSIGLASDQSRLFIDSHALPSTLIIGKSGSGKTALGCNIIESFYNQFGDSLRLIIVDPKGGTDMSLTTAYKSLEEKDRLTILNPAEDLELLIQVFDSMKEAYEEYTKLRSSGLYAESLLKVPPTLVVMDEIPSYLGKQTDKIANAMAKAIITRFRKASSLYRSIADNNRGESVGFFFLLMSQFGDKDSLGDLATVCRTNAYAISAQLPAPISRNIHGTDVAFQDFPQGVFVVSKEGTSRIFKSMYSSTWDPKNLGVSTGSK